MDGRWWCVVVGLLVGCGRATDTPPPVPMPVPSWEAPSREEEDTPPVPVDSASCQLMQGLERLAPFDGLIQGTRECLPGGWCTTNLYSAGNTEFGLWGFSERDVWAVGGVVRGVALHWDGVRWAQVSLPPAEALHAVWGSAPEDVWAVGAGGTVVRWEGSTWQRVPTPTKELLTGVSGTSSDDVWVVGPRVALHWDGERFTESPSFVTASAEPMPFNPTQMSVWAMSPTDVVAAGFTGCRRWDGTRWSDAACGVRSATGVWASGSDDVWVVGTEEKSSGRVTYRAHWDGRAWSTEKLTEGSPEFSEAFRSVFGFSRDDVWVNGTWHYDGRQWTRVCGDVWQGRLWGPSSGRLFGSAQGMLSRLDGSGWTALGRTSGTYPRSPANGAWAVLNARVLRYDGTRWTDGDGAQGTWGGRSFAFVFGSGPDDVWALGPNGLEHHDGQAWTRGPHESLGPGFASSRTEAFALHLVDRARPLWRWDGQAWEPVPEVSGDDLKAMAGSGPDEVWAVGEHHPRDGAPAQGVAWHWDGASWRRVFAEPGPLLQQVLSFGGQDVWAIDHREPSTRVSVLRWNGSTFEPSVEIRDVSIPPLIAGTGPDDVWVTAGPASPLYPPRTRLFHFDGHAWTEAEPLPGTIRQLWALPGVALFAAEEHGIVFERRRPVR